MTEHEIRVAVEELDMMAKRLDDIKDELPTIQKMEIQKALRSLYIARTELNDLAEEIRDEEKKSKMTALEFLAKLTAILADFNAEDIADCEVLVYDGEGGEHEPCISVEDGYILIYG